MGVFVSDDGSASEDIAAPSGAARLVADLRAACTPANLTVIGTLAVGWLALIGWTGAGSEGWQARSCARLALQPAACRMVRPAKDMSRLVPHADVAGLAR